MKADKSEESELLKSWLQFGGAPGLGGGGERTSSPLFKPGGQTMLYPPPFPLYDPNANILK